MEQPNDRNFDNSFNPDKQNKVFYFHSSKQRKIQVWTKEEDAKLIEIGKENNFKDWKEISKKMHNRTPTQCSGRYKRIRPGIIKGGWTKEEDEMVVKLINEHGKNWSIVSNLILTKNSKQIRDRYINKLDKNVRNGKFTKEEDEKILMYYTRFGRRWTKIASFFNGRTGDMIKNRFYSCIRKKINHIQRSSQKISNLEVDENKKKEKFICLKNIKPQELEIISQRDIEYICEDTKILTSHNNLSLKEEDSIELIQTKVEEFSIYGLQKIIIPELLMEKFSQNYDESSIRSPTILNSLSSSSNILISNNQYNQFHNTDVFFNYPCCQNSIKNNHPEFLLNQRKIEEINNSFKYIKRNIVSGISSAQMQILELILKNSLNN